MKNSERYSNQRRAYLGRAAAVLIGLTALISASGCRTQTGHWPVDTYDDVIELQKMNETGALYQK